MPMVIGATEKKISVQVVSHGWHVGLVLPAQYLNLVLPDLAQRFPSADYYEVGWGDDGFYQSEQQTTAMALNALLASRGAVLHVVSVTGLPTDFFREHDMATFCVDSQQLVAMVNFVADSFVRHADGHLVMREPGRYGDSQFYQARGRYTMAYTCNRWVAQVLHRSGMAVSDRFMLTSGSVMRAVRSNEKSCVLP